MALRLRRGTDAERQLVTPLQGELVYATDTKKLYIGDGSTAGGVLVGPTEADAFTEVIGDTTPQLGGDLDLNGNSITGTGNINIDGTITATGNIGLGDDASDVINVAGVINSSLRPAIDGGYDLGTSVRRWNTLHAEGAEITGQLSADTISITSIIGADSTLVYDNSTDTLSASIINANTFDGNLTGNVTGNLEGDVTSTGLSAFNQLTAESVVITGGTLDGVTIGSDTEIAQADITGREIRAQNGFFGNFTGDLFGNVQGDLRGSLTAGSVYGGDSSLIINGDTSQVVGDVNNDIVTTTQVNSATVNLSGRDPGNAPAGVLITTTDTYADGPQFSAIGHADTSDGLAIQFGKFRGTPESPASLQAGDEIATMLFIGGDANGAPTPAAAIRTVIEDTPVAGNAKAGLFLATQDSSGTLVPSFSIDGNQGANFYGPAKLHSFADATARDAAITSPAAGMMIYLTATNKAQVYNGTAWTDLH